MNLTGSKCSNDRIKNILMAPVHHKKLLLVIAFLLLFYTCARKNLKNTQFDYLIFSQRWLPSACIEYTEHGSSSENPHYCAVPNAFESWTIHGLWPTQNNHLGPFFCNRSMPFDIHKVQSIESDLELHWPNIEGGKSVQSLWEHEWDKHGTCAAELNLLNSEIKYFSTTLKLLKVQNVQNVFQRNSIFPSLNPEINISDLFYIIKGAFGKWPQIHCIQEVKKNQALLSEIRLCYNKNLELIDCPGIIGIKFYRKTDVTQTLTNCPFNRKVVLPNSEFIKSLSKNSRKTDYYDMLVDFLHIVRFLQWASI